MHSRTAKLDFSRWYSTGEIGSHSSNLTQNYRPRYVKTSVSIHSKLLICADSQSTIQFTSLLRAATANNSQKRLQSAWVPGQTDQSHQTTTRFSIGAAAGAGSLATSPSIHWRGKLVKLADLLQLFLKQYPPPTGAKVAWTLAAQVASVKRMVVAFFIMLAKVLGRWWKESGVTYLHIEQFLECLTRVCLIQMGDGVGSINGEVVFTYRVLFRRVMLALTSQ